VDLCSFFSSSFQFLTYCIFFAPSQVAFLLTEASAPPNPLGSASKGKNVSYIFISMLSSSASLFSRAAVRVRTAAISRSVPSILSVAASRAYASSSAQFPEQTGNTGNKHRSNAEELIAKVNVVEVDGPVALCDGGGGSLGHPLEYIKLDWRHPDVPVECKYCGIRYVMKKH